MAWWFWTGKRDTATATYEGVKDEYDDTTQEMTDTAGGRDQRQKASGQSYQLFRHENVVNRPAVYQS